MLTRAEKEKTKSREFAGLLNSIAFFSRQITAEVKFDARAIGQICELVWYGLKEHLNNEDVARGCCHLLIILPHMCSTLVILLKLFCDFLFNLRSQLLCRMPRILKTET